MRSIALLFLAGCASWAPWDSDTTAAAIGAWHLRTEPAPLAHVKPCRIGSDPALVAAVCDYQVEWWGFFGVYHLTDGSVDWQARTEHEPLEQAIHSLRVLELPGQDHPLLEVYGITHMGNGNLYLYELRQDRLILLLETRALDFNADLEQFRDGKLESTYRDVNEDGCVDVTLNGIIEEWDEKGNILVDSRLCRKVFLWSPIHGRFVEDPARRMGFASSD